MRASTRFATGSSWAGNAASYRPSWVITRGYAALRIRGAPGLPPRAERLLPSPTLVIAYLSDAWIDALDAALDASNTLAALAPLVLEQVVENTPRGEVRYRLTIDADGAHARRSQSDASAPDLRITTDHATAVAIAQGRENAQTALAGGRLRIGGSIEVLIARADLWNALDDATAQLRADTSYDNAS